MCSGQSGIGWKRFSSPPLYYSGFTIITITPTIHQSLILHNLSNRQKCYITHLQKQLIDVNDSYYTSRKHMLNKSSKHRVRTWAGRKNIKMCRYNWNPAHTLSTAQYLTSYTSTNLYSKNKNCFLMWPSTWKWKHFLKTLWQKYWLVNALWDQRLSCWWF